MTMCKGVHYVILMAGLLFQLTFAFQVSRVKEFFDSDTLLDLQLKLENEIEKRSRLPYIIGEEVQGDDIIKRIIISPLGGGGDATKGVYKWQAALMFNNVFTGQFDFVCGAALIGERWLLTATHCIDSTYGASRNDPKKYKVVLGGHNLKRPTGEEVIVTPDKFITHADFHLDASIGFPNDIGLVRLEKTIDTSSHDNIEAISLPAPGDDFIGVPDCHITGWGITQADNPYSYPTNLQEANAVVIENQSCQKKIATLSQYPILNSHICVGGDQFATACTGDSGSPLSCRVNGLWKLAGIFSWHVECSGLPSIYTRTSHYLPWIVKAMANS